MIEALDVDPLNFGSFRSATRCSRRSGRSRGSFEPGGGVIRLQAEPGLLDPALEHPDVFSPARPAHRAIQKRPTRSVAGRPCLDRARRQTSSPADEVGGNMRPRKPVPPVSRIIGRENSPSGTALGKDILEESHSLGPFRQAVEPGPYLGHRPPDLLTLGGVGVVDVIIVLQDGLFPRSMGVRKPKS